MSIPTSPRRRDFKKPYLCVFGSASPVFKIEYEEQTLIFNEIKMFGSSAPKLILSCDASLAEASESRFSF